MISCTTYKLHVNFKKALILALVINIFCKLKLKNFLIPPLTRYKTCY